jgi:hypothetical protein
MECEPFVKVEDTLELTELVDRKIIVTELDVVNYAENLIDSEILNTEER